MEPELHVDDVARAADRLAGVANLTPELTSRTLDERFGARLRMKAECFQRTGSFKFRGAYNAVASLPPDVRERGVITYSSGNHGQAIALAAALHDISAVVVMPDDAPAVKRAATVGYGAEVVGYDRYNERREDIGERLGEQRGLTLIPPYDHLDVMAGQGTVALELFNTGLVDTLVVCVGGGGLISGCATVARSMGDVRVIGVEPAAGDDVKQSLERGRIVELPETPRTIADGQQTRAPGVHTFPVIRDRVDEIVTVTDDEIIVAMQLAFQRLNVVVEPSGATALAAVLSGAIDVAGQRVGITVSGGNVDLDRFRALTA
ncbi:MAG: pyridoxal-phosphate dependent enzyme [Actinomycetota bacterium]